MRISVLVIGLFFSFIYTTTAQPADSAEAAVATDTSIAPLDTSGILADTSGIPLDSTALAADSLAMDTIPVVKIPTIEERIGLEEGESLPPRRAVREASRLLASGDKEAAYWNYRHASAGAKDFDTQYNLGKLAFELKDYDVAVKAFETAERSMRRKDEKKNPLFRYDYGVALKHSCKYNQALEQFDKFFQEAPSARGLDDVDMWLSKTRLHVEGSTTAMDNIRGKSPFSVANFTPTNTYENENSPAVIGPQEIMFASQGAEGSILKTVKVGEKAMAAPGELSSGDEILDPFIGPNGEKLYFTKKEDDRYVIYMCDIVNGGYKNFQKILKGVNKKDTNNKTPVVVKYRGNSQIMYFASDREGGFGGWDLWYSVRMSDGSFSRPENLGRKINSDYDEITPYYADETLYYSTDHPHGAGGFDVWRAKGNQQLWDDPANMSFPINSCADDYYFRFSTSYSGFFTSNRNGSKSISFKNAFDDIYVFTSLSASIPSEGMPDYNSLGMIFPEEAPAHRIDIAELQLAFSRECACHNH